MRDLNLGPDSKKLIDRYRETSDQKLGSYFAAEMSRMLERWLEVGWCWVDAAPATVCGGPHVKVRYSNSKLVEIIEPANKVGETFPDVPYTIIKSG